MNQNMFGSFQVGGREFALPVELIQEVVNAPPRLTPFPLAPPYLRGFFNLRGAIVPVVDLKALLDLAADERPPGDGKIAIVDFEGLRVGIAVDELGEIFRAPAEVVARMSLPNGATGVVRGVITLGGGARSVQVLDARAVVNLDHVPRQAVDPDRHRPKRNLRRRCISFTVGAGRCAFPIGSVREILRVPEVRASALTHPSSLGMFEVRGQLLPLIDFARLLNASTGAADQDPNFRRVLVMETAGQRFGLLVASVESIVAYLPEDLLPLPGFAEGKPNLFAGCIAQPDAPETILLNEDAVLSEAEVAAIARAHAQIYRGDDAGPAGRQRARGLAHITFRLVNLMALGMSEVREVLDVPRDLIRPPGLPPAVRGLMNLRGLVVTVFDAREVYGMPVRADEAATKLLIFERGERVYGMIVDDLETIVTFGEADRIPLPAVCRPNEAGLGEDVRFAVELKATESARYALILNLDRLVDRVGAA